MAFDFSGWVGGVVSGGWLPKIPAATKPQQQPAQQTQPNIFDNLYKEAERNVTQIATAAQPYFSKTAQQQQQQPTSLPAYRLQEQTRPIEPAQNAVDTTTNWLKGASSGGWLPKQSDITSATEKLVTTPIEATKQTISYVGSQLSQIAQQPSNISTWLPKSEVSPTRQAPSSLGVSAKREEGIQVSSLIPTETTKGNGDKFATTTKALVGGTFAVAKTVNPLVSLLVTPLEERKVSDFIDQTFTGKSSEEPLPYIKNPNYLSGRAASENPLLYKFERAYDITTGTDIARAQKNAEIDAYNAQLLLKPALQAEAKFGTKFEELVKKNVLVGGTTTVDPATNKTIYNYDTYKWAGNAKPSDVSDLENLSTKAAASFTAYSSLQKQSEQKQADVASRTQLSTDVLTPYIGSFAKAQEDLWKSPIYAAGDYAKSLAPEPLKPATDRAIGVGAGFLSTLPYINPYVFAATSVVPYLPSHVERLIKSPAHEAQYAAGVAGTALTGMASQAKEAFTGTDLSGQSTGRGAEAAGAGLALIFGGRTLKTIETASPLKYGGRSEFMTGGSITKEAPLHSQIISKITGSELKATTVPESVAWKGIYYESPKISLQKAVGKVPTGYSPEGSLTPIIGRIAPTEGASSWLQRKYATFEKPVTKEGKSTMVIETDFSKPYKPNLSLEVESPIYKPVSGSLKTSAKGVAEPVATSSPVSSGLLSDIKYAREVVSPSGKIVTGMPTQLGQYVAKEGYVPDFASMTVATPLMQKIYKESGTPQAAKIYAAEMEQFKKIWQETKRPELVKNLSTTLPKTEIVPKSITESTVIYPKEIPKGQVSDWSGQPIPKNAAMGKVFHHIAYPDKGVWLTETEHTLLHDIKDGKVKLDTSNSAFYAKYKITTPKPTKAVTKTLTVEERKAAADELLNIIKSVDKKHTISGSLTEYLQAKVARLPKDLDMYTDKHVDMANAIGDYYKKYLGSENVQIKTGKDASSVSFLNKETGKFDIKAVDLHSHEFGGKLGTTIGRYYIKSEAPIIVDGMNLMPLREQRLRKLSATMAVGKTEGGQFYSTAMDFRRFKDIGDVLGGSTSMEATAMESIFGKRKAADIAETRKVLESKIGSESPITAEHKKTASKRYEQFAPTEPTNSYTRIPLTKRYYPSIGLAKGAAVVGGVGAGVAAGYVYAAPLGSAFQSVLGQQKQTDNNKDMYGLGASPASGFVMIGGVAVGSGRRKLRETMIEGGLKESAFKVKPRTDIRLIEDIAETPIKSTISRTPAQFRGYNPLEFEQGKGLSASTFEKITPTLKQMLPRTERDILYMGKQLESKLISSDPLFAQKQVKSIKPYDMKTNSWNGLLNIFTDKKNNITLFGSKTADLFVELGVGRSVRLSDIDGIMPVNQMASVSKKIKNILDSTQKGEFSVTVEGTGNNRVINIIHKKTGNTIIELHPIETFPNIKLNEIEVALPGAHKLTIASPEYSTRGKMAGLFDETLITKRGAKLIVKRIKDLPDLIGRYRQVAADYYKKAELEGKDSPKYNDLIVTAQESDALAKAYKKYLYSSDIEKSVKIASRDAIIYEFRTKLEELIQNGDLPPTTKELPISEAHKKMVELTNNDPSINKFRGKTLKDYIDQFVLIDPTDLGVDLIRARGIVKYLKDPTVGIKKPAIKKIPSTQVIPELPESRKPYYMPSEKQISTDPKKTDRSQAYMPTTTMIRGTLRGSLPSFMDESVSQYPSTQIKKSSKYPISAEDTQGYTSTYPKSAAYSILGGIYKKSPEYPKQETYKKSPKYPKSDIYPGVITPPKIRDYSVSQTYPESKPYPKSPEYATSIEYPLTAKYPEIIDYPVSPKYTKATEYPATKPYSPAVPYSPVTPYPKTTTPVYPKTTEYIKSTPYPKQVPYSKTTPYSKPEIYPEYTKIVTLPKPIKTWDLLTPQPEEIPKKKKKKKFVTPKHWEYGAGANPEEVTEFVFGAAPKATLTRKGKKKDLIIDRLSSGMFDTGK